MPHVPSGGAHTRLEDGRRAQRGAERVRRMCEREHVRCCVRVRGDRMQEFRWERREAGRHCVCVSTSYLYGERRCTVEMRNYASSGSTDSGSANWSQWIRAGGCSSCRSNTSTAGTSPRSTLPLTLVISHDSRAVRTRCTLSWFSFQTWFYELHSHPFCTKMDAKVIKGDIGHRAILTIAGSDPSGGAGIQVREARPGFRHGVVNQRTRRRT
jgi:hypothetical protein